MELHPFHRQFVRRLPEVVIEGLVGVEEVGSEQGFPCLCIKRIEPLREAFVVVAACLEELLGKVRKFSIGTHISSRYNMPSAPLPGRIAARMAETVQAAHE